MSVKSVSTAFQRSHVEKKSASLFDTIKEYFDIGFRFLIPDEVQEMPIKAMYFVGIMSNLAAAVVFYLLVYQSYNSNISTIFLSPNNSSSTGDCFAVQRPISASYLVDEMGYWESSSFFDSSRAMYQFTFQNYYVSETNWSVMIHNLESNVKIIGDRMSGQILAANLVYWTAWTGHFSSNSNGDTTVDRTSTTQLFNFYGNPSIIFNRQYVHGLISNVDSDCNATSNSNFDAGTHIMSTTYSYNDFVTNPSCSRIVDPVQVGFDALYDGDQFTLSMDVRSLVTALAVNMHVIDIPQLRPVVGTLGPYSYLGVSYIIGSFYNLRYPGMTPITCLLEVSALKNYTFAELSTNSNSTCFFQFKNGTYAFPLLNSVGFDTTSPSFCTCDNGVGQKQECQVFNLMSGYLLFSDLQSLDLADSNPFLDMFQRIPPSLVSQNAYEAMFIATASTGAGSGNVSRTQAYEFCTLPYATCSIVTINTFDDVNMAVNNYFYELFNGSCSNSVSISAEAFNNMAANPPESLVENYYECSKKPVTVLSSAIGTSVGNILAVRPFLFILFVQIYFIILYYQGKPPLQTYTKEERDDALKGLALQLLMMRDNRLPATRSGALYKARSDRERESSICSPRALSCSPSPGSGSSAPVGISSDAQFSGGPSILRLLTDELMENAYISTYFKEGSQRGKEQQERADNAQPTRRTTTTRNTTTGTHGDIELADMEATDSPFHDLTASVSLSKSVTVLNEELDISCDTIQEFTCVESDTAAAEHLVSLLSGLINRLIATTTDNAVEDFWDISGHSAVLHRFDLDAFRHSVLKNTSDLNVYVTLLMKIYQLLQVHIRIMHACSVEDAHRYDRKTGYIIGNKIYTVSDIDEMYNNAIALALKNDIKLSIT